MYVRPTPGQIEGWIKANVPHFRTRESSKHGLIYLFDNPMVPGDHGFHVGVSPESGWVNDYRPQYDLGSKSFIKFVADVERISYSEAVKELCGNNAYSIIRDALSELKNKDHIVDYAEENPDFSLPKGYRNLSEKQDSIGWKIATNYLESRQVSIDEAKDLGVIYNPMNLCFVYHEYGIPVYWQARSIAEKSFLFPKGSTAEDFLYGYDGIEPLGDLFITEAIFDKIMLGENCIATGGAVIKPNQVRKIRSLNPGRIILAPDNDDAGLISLRKNIELLDPYFPGKIYYVLPGNGKKDWNDMGKEMGRLDHKNIVLHWAKSRVKILSSAALIRLTMPVMRRINDERRKTKFTT